MHVDASPLLIFCVSPEQYLQSSRGHGNGGELLVRVADWTADHIRLDAELMKAAIFVDLAG